MGPDDLPGDRFLPDEDFDTLREGTSRGRDDGVQGPARHWVPEQPVDRGWLGNRPLGDADDDDVPLTGRVGLAELTRRYVGWVLALMLLLGAAFGAVTATAVGEAQRADEEQHRVALVLAPRSTTGDVITLSAMETRGLPSVDVLMRLFNRGAPVTFDAIRSVSDDVSVRASEDVAGKTVVPANSFADIRVTMTFRCRDPVDDVQLELDVHTRDGTSSTVRAPLPEGLLRSGHDFACS